MRCIYCEKELFETSKEHIIHNALGGQLVSTEICCPSCNNSIQRLIDNDFTSIFAPVTGRISNLKKTSKTKSKPSYAGIARYEDKIYDVFLKDGKVASCKQLCVELKSNLTKEVLDRFAVIGYRFDLDNKSFSNGMAKIACNYAIFKGIPSELLKKGIELKIIDEVLVDIKFNYMVIPFVALNNFDFILETATSMELYHNLILFNIEETLWCYIDLFNTFQYYVLLSNEWSGDEVYECYAQTIEIMERHVPNIHARKPKDIHMYSQMYGVEPTMDIDVLRDRIKNKINKASYERDIAEILKTKMNLFDFMIEMGNCRNDQIEYLRNMSFYLDEDDCLAERLFRRYTPSVNSTMKNYESYPHLVYELLNKNFHSARNYTENKFERLNKYLCFR